MKPHIRRLSGALALALTLTATAALGADQPSSVTISNFTFSPQTVTVPAGATVTWINGDDVPHVVRAVDGAFHSKPMDTDEQFAFTFAKPGVYSYFCSLHPHMTGKVIVGRP